MPPIRPFRNAYFFKIAAFTIGLSIIPLLILTGFGLFQFDNAIEKLTTYQLDLTVENVLEQKYALLVKESASINAGFAHVESDLLLLQTQAATLLSENPAADSLPSLTLVDRPAGYRWEPMVRPEEANIFLSASAPRSDAFYRRLRNIKRLSPLLAQAANNEPLVDSFYFCFPESAWLTYPAMDIDYEVSIHKLPADLRLENYDFYRFMTPAYNPERKLRWSPPYDDVSHWDRVVTAAAPVYLPSGQFAGMVAADYPMAHIARHILSLQFTEPNAFAFIIDDKGRLIAGQEKTPEPLPPASLRQVLEERQGIQRIALSQGAAYHMYAPIANTGWFLNFVIPEQDIREPFIAHSTEQISRLLHDFSHSFFAYVAVVSLVLVFFSYRFSKTVTEPVRRLTEAFRESSQGKRIAPVPVVTKDELGQLTATFNQMNETIHSLITELNNRATRLEERVLERTQEIQAANQQLQATYQQLKQTEASRTELIAQISHDLKTPLTVMKAGLQILEKYDLTQEERIDLTDRVKRQTRQITQLIDDLFELSTMELQT
ncbi:HAMP domain-containing protein [Heliobacterium gestii]|uniref:histidine kinase n=1 Tax=Heliomicrobium gestii TaxID=2699 RepID=A0A845L8A9_HELGE|nr:histidine kinase dimerization/phospho-acceptor domain-containing protein [Heliomicrobium gestii]MBM7866227.1 HAMP domain-containing protein [Heliomicrobium gestii]MZP42977.1 HAMP domain-containing protein [Heliomicrobium gestii]